MGRLTALISVLLILFLAFPFKATAHTLATDGKISAFLHIDPDDKPQVGKLNTIHFYFNDQDFRFTMEGCDCAVQVLDGKKALYKGVLPSADRRVGVIKVLLPDNNVSYPVQVTGTPKTAGFFQPFKLKFDIDVGNPPPEQPQKPNRWPLIAGIIIVAIVAAGLIIKMRGPKIKPKEEL